MRTKATETVRPGTFEPDNHFYPRAVNAQIHSLVRYFMNLAPDRVVRRFVHLNPRTDASALAQILAYAPKHFRWAGADLMHVTNEAGVRQMVVVETNSCPSGQKSMPLYEEHDELGGYRTLLMRSFLPLLKKGGRRLPEGGLAVIFDKNRMEASGYAAALAELTGEDVLLVPMGDQDPEPKAKFVEGVLMVQEPQGDWRPIRAAFRYVTQRPWNRIPIRTKTLIFNPVLACIAGGRNKMVAAKAYDLYNGEISESGLAIRTPETIWDVAHNEVPLWVQRLNGHAVIKVPYSNAGQGVFTITNSDELDAFMELDQRYDRLIVQGLIGNRRWSSGAEDKRLYHVGTVPTKSGASHVFDLRVMVSGGAHGFAPVAIYARRARSPLVEELDTAQASWDVLGTNLSVKAADGGWDSDVTRLRLMDRKDFNSLGIGLDDLIEAYVQTVLSTIAIDKMATNLMNAKGRFRLKLFKSLNDDAKLIEELTL